MRIVALIPARSGSKRVPDKNIKLLLGKPLLSYAIDSAVNCKLVNDVYVSSDSKHYLDIGKQFGAKPCLRSTSTATDESNMRDVVDEFLLFLSGQGIYFDAIIILCPAHPIRTFRHVENILKSYLNQGNQRPLVGLITPATHPYLCYKRDGKGHVNNVMNIDVNSFYRHQQYPKYYQLTLWACVVPVDSVKHLNAQMMCSDSYGYIIPEHVPFVNIDTPLDFEFAEFLMQKIKSGKIEIDA